MTLMFQKFSTHDYSIAFISYLGLCTLHFIFFILTVFFFKPLLEQAIVFPTIAIQIFDFKTSIIVILSC